MNKILQWVRGNWVIVACGGVIVVTLGLAPWFSGAIESSVQKTAEERARKVTEIAGFERTSVQLDVPGQEPRAGSGVVNASLLEQYRSASTKLQADAEAVRGLAVEHNRKGRGVVSPEAFPQPPKSQRETIQFEVHAKVVKAYADLLARLRAGGPPAPDAVGAELERREAQFITNTIRKRSRAELDARELADLDAELLKTRLVRYGERARELSFYASPEVLDVPGEPTRTQVATSMLFDWQWRFWMTEDVLEAIAIANAGAASVVESPVKRVVQLMVLDELPGARGGGEGSPGSGFTGDGVPGRRGIDGSDAGGEGSPPPPSEDAALGPMTIDASVEAPLDFARSFTGRVSNSIYDVRLVELVAVVSTAKLPRLFDALASRNFMTVLDVKLRPADAFDAAGQGYIYGTDPVSEVTLLIETVWLREWTAPFMPGDLRAALGIGGGIVPMGEG